MCISVRHLPVQACASVGVLYLAFWFSFLFATKAAVQNKPRSRPKVYSGPTGEASTTPLPFRSPELPERAGTFCRNVVIL